MPRSREVNTIVIVGVYICVRKELPSFTDRLASPETTTALCVGTPPNRIGYYFYLIY